MCTFNISLLVLTLMFWFTLTFHRTIRRLSKGRTPYELTDSSYFAFCYPDGGFDPESMFENVYRSIFIIRASPLSMIFLLTKGADLNVNDSIFTGVTTTVLWEKSSQGWPFQTGIGTNKAAQDHLCHRKYGCLRCHTGEPTSGWTWKSS